MALLLPAAAQASAAHLERAFGKDGIRYLPQSLRELGGAALLGDGRVLVGNGRELRALLPSGRFDGKFGDEGIARIGTGPRSHGTILGFGIDAEDRPVAVVPSAKLIGYESIIERLTPQGRPDPSFGRGRGYFLADFGVPAPETGKTRHSYLEGIAFDSAGRLLVMGRTAVGTRPGPVDDGPSTEAVEEAFVARLDHSGRLDTSFAARGVFRDPGVERLAASQPVDRRDWSVGPNGKVALYAGSGEDD